MICSRRGCITFALAAAAAHAQTLAHPGWRGNGIAAEAWWRHTTIVRLGSETTFAQASAVMDAMSAAGVDTMLLPDPQPAAGALLPFAERFGTEDDLDALLREASARRMHVMVTAPLLRLAGSSGEVRFWLSRGIAGFDVGAVKPFEMDTLLLLRAQMDRFPGQPMLLVRTSTAFRAMRGGPVLRMLQPGKASSGAFALELESGPEPASVPVGAVPVGAVPVVDAALLEKEAGREQVRRMLGARVWPARARRELRTQ